MPHALSTLQNPLYSHDVWAPHGVDLSWMTNIPGPSLVMSPVTKLFGPLISYNVLLIVAPALAGWAAYLLCHRVTKASWPSLAGGYLFGFSTYMVGEMPGTCSSSWSSRSRLPSIWSSAAWRAPSDPWRSPS